MKLTLNSRHHRLLVLLLISILMLPLASNAQEPYSTEEDGTIITFRQLGFDDQIIFTPGNESYTFALPADWQVNDDIQLNLDIKGFVEGNPFSIGEDNTITVLADDPSQVAIIEPIFNQAAITPIVFPLQGNQTLVTSLPADSANNAGSDGKHQLDLSFDSAFECRGGRTGGLVVSGDSYLVVPHETRPLQLDLRQLPYPFQQQTLGADQVVIVTPDAPVKKALEAALNIAAGMGRMTNNEVEVQIVPLNVLSEEIRNSNHLIFVGGISEFPILSEVQLPLQAGENAVGLVEEEENDGVLQLASSPWNPAKAVLLVSGETNDGIYKASQGFSAGALRTSQSNDVAYISGVSGVVASPPTMVEVDFRTQTIQNTGIDTLVHEFDIPPGYEPDFDTVLQLLISHSTLLNYDQSGISVRLNDTPLGTIRFSDDTANISLQNFSVSRSLFKLPGRNQLTLEAALTPRDVCSDFEPSSIWLSILEESNLTIPLAQIEDELTSPTLDKYASALIADSALANTHFVVAADNPNSWNVAAQIASELGTFTDDSPLNISLFWADEVEEARNAGNLIVIGYANSLPIVSELGSVLPLPFDEGSNFANESNLVTNYRLPDSKELGYVQLVESPFNADFNVLTILGTTDQVINRASEALVDDDIRAELIENFAIIDGERAVTEELIDDASEEEVAAAEGPASGLPFPNANTGEDDELTWIPIFVGISSVAVVIMLVIFLGIPLLRRNS